MRAEILQSSWGQAWFDQMLVRDVARVVARSRLPLPPPPSPNSQSCPHAWRTQRTDWAKARPARHACTQKSCSQRHKGEYRVGRKLQGCRGRTTIERERGLWPAFSSPPPPNPTHRPVRPCKTTKSSDQGAKRMGECGYTKLDS